MEKEHEDFNAKVTPEQKKDFYIPERCCPERFPSPQLPSPADCLPPEVLERVIEEIRDANELLLDLALADDRPLEETFQKVFDGLIGLQVEIKNQLGETIEGRVTLAGFNFVVLQEEEMTFILPYSQIELIKPSGRFAEPFPGPELTEIDPCLRRDLTFHFGEVVSSSPELIHLFFRIQLEIYLLILESKRIQVKVDGSTLEGLLADVNKETIDLKVEGERTIIPIDKISLITIKS
jgi:hypothetical protein